MERYRLQMLATRRHGQRQRHEYASDLSRRDGRSRRGQLGWRTDGNLDATCAGGMLNTPAQVTDLWTNSPRTCEYYYVFADGKTNDAVGVAATPEKLELVRPGQADERLGDGITDAVVLSAGSRLETLRSRVIENDVRLTFKRRCG